MKSGETTFREEGLAHLATIRSLVEARSGWTVIETTVGKSGLALDAAYLPASDMDWSKGYHVRVVEDFHYGRDSWRSCNSYDYPRNSEYHRIEVRIPRPDTMYGNKFRYYKLENIHKGIGKALEAAEKNLKRLAEQLVFDAGVRDAKAANEKALGDVVAHGVPGLFKGDHGFFYLDHQMIKVTEDGINLSIRLNRIEGEADSLYRDRLLETLQRIQGV